MLSKLKQFYETKYKFLLFIPFLLLLLALTQISMQWYHTGDFLHKGVSLEGGVTVTVPGASLDIRSIESALFDAYVGSDIVVKELRSGTGAQSGIVIDAAIPQENLDSFLTTLSTGTGISREEMTVEFFGPSLGESFFRQTIIALIVAFFCMGVVVFLYFRTFVPSIAVMLAAFSDIVITLAIVNLLGVRLSTAGIAAFLMLIGYSVDTDILLTIHVVKRKDEADLNQRIYNALKTGVLMTLTALAAVVTVLVFTNSAVLAQIMLILSIGLCVDLLTTWIQNAGMLRLYMHKKYGEGR